jgi:hypothetical protein
VADLPSWEAPAQLVGAIPSAGQVLGAPSGAQRELAFILAERGKQAPADSAEQA